mmetsp:Transcript_30887/g.63127  ORF Transcript_30887/g.63127 Transcript_30887/m.63127 type:complete len:87 (+) Transcript_30887:163-423(+)
MTTTTNGRMMGINPILVLIVPTRTNKGVLHFRETINLNSIQNNPKEGHGRMSATFPYWHHWADHHRLFFFFAQLRVIDVLNKIITA